MARKSVLMLCGFAAVVVLGFSAKAWSAPTPVLASNGAACTIIGTAGDDVLTGTAAANVICGLGGNDTINGLAGNDVIDAGSGNDTIYGGVGNDTIDPGPGSDNVSGDAGTNTVYYATSSTDLNINLASGSTTGNGFMDTLAGIQNVTSGSGNDTISGSSVANLIDAGSGDDTVTADLGNDSIKGGDGTDAVDFSAVTANVTANLVTGTSSGAGTDKLTAVENIIGGSGNDTLTGDANNNVLTGGPGNDTINPGVGTDTVNGGLGADVFSLSNQTVDTTVNLLTGSATATNLTDTFTGIENVTTGSGNDVLTGDSNKNVLTGGAGDDLIYPMTGADSIAGGLGKNTVSFSSFSTGVTINLSTGKATGIGITGSLSGITNVIGGSGNDTITGNSDSNNLTGGSGSDVINGGSGDDYLAGEAGNDVLDSGSGNDRLVGGNGDDSISGGEGTDTVDYSANLSNMKINLYGLRAYGDGTDSLSALENAIGGLGDDTIIGNGNPNQLEGKSGNDFIDGNDGNDIIDGGLGDDSLIGGAGGDGIDGKQGKNLCQSDDQDLYVSRCGFDDSPPQVLSISAQSYQIDNRASDRTVSLTMKVEDDLTGVSRIRCALRPINGQGPPIWTVNSTLTEGDSRSGTWRCSMSAQMGTLGTAQYRIDLVVSDYAKNALWQLGTNTGGWVNGLDPSAPISTLGRSYFDVLGRDDWRGPRLADISSSAGSIDVSEVAGSVELTFRLVDEIAGVEKYACGLASPVTYINDSSLAVAELVSGTIYDGWWKCTLTIPKSSPTYTYPILLRGTDKTVNYSEYMGSVDNGWNSNFNYVWPGDAPYLPMSQIPSGPSVISVTGGPSFASQTLTVTASKLRVDTSSKSDTVTFDYSIANLGFVPTYSRCWLETPSGAWTANGQLLSGGSSSNSCTVKLPVGSHSGKLLLNISFDKIIYSDSGPLLQWTIAQFGGTVTGGWALKPVFSGYTEVGQAIPISINGQGPAFIENYENLQ